jgi:hypothetical protein
MDVQIIQHEMPLTRMLIALYQQLNMCESVLLGTPGPPGWLDGMAGHHIEIDEPRQNAMSSVLELAAEYMAGLHRQIEMLAPQSTRPY